MLPKPMKLCAITGSRFGLSYTTFAYSTLTATASKVSFRVRNTGDVAGAEVAQLYLGFPDSTGLPPKQLKGFKRLKLVPGASQEVTVPLTSADLSTYSSVAGVFVDVKGEFKVMVGASATDIRLTGTFTV